MVQSRAVLIVAAGHDQAAVGAEGDGLDPIAVGQRRPQGLARRRVPEPGRPVLAAGQDTASPVGLKATVLTPFPWRKRGPIGSPVAAFQSRAVLS